MYILESRGKSFQIYFVCGGCLIYFMLQCFAFFYHILMVAYTFRGGVVKCFSNILYDNVFVFVGHFDLSWLPNSCFYSPVNG